MKFDIQGRLANMDLPDGKAAVLYSVYEAVSNSIHAINDRFGEADAASKGKVSVEIDLDDNSEVSKLIVTDNGVGFTPENLRSFETSDSRYKYVRGGKGVGRFVWIKTFSDISVVSRYQSGSAIQRISFDFDPNPAESVRNLSQEVASGEPGTKIIISSPHKSQGGKINHATFLKDLALHFFSLFISKNLPKIELTYNGTTKNLNEFIEGRVDLPVRTSVFLDVEGEAWKLDIDHIYVDPTISTELKNSYLLTAHGRLVGDPISIDAKYSLNSLENGRSYVAVVSGAPLDDRVDQQRMNFRFNKHQQEVLEHAVLKSAEGFLKDHIKKVRSRQKKTVKMVLFEHPQLASQIQNLNEYVQTLSPGMDDEQIGQHLFVLLYREEKKLRETVATIAASDGLDARQRKEVEATLKELAEQERSRLAELVVKRHQVLQTANMLVKYSDETKEKYYYEKVVHDLICPMGKMYKSGRYDDHNLWILDESLASYQMFASDKSIRSLVGPEGSKKEPDLVFFNPLGFWQPDTDAPVTIVEFKRPGDASPSKNPVDQVLEYIEKFQNHSVKDLDGEIISKISDRTPFNCYIVCELTKETRALLARSVAQTETPDGEGFYGWSKPHNATIHVMSFRKMLRDAELRNSAFFDALKLIRPSMEAKRRAARAREKRVALDQALVA